MRLAIDAGIRLGSRLFASLLALLAFCPLMGCSTETEGTGKRLRMAMMPKIKGIGYFNACEEGARAAAAELGIDLVFDGPNTDDAEKQAQMLEEWIAVGYDIIAVAANDPERLAPVIKKAKDQGIIVLTFDADVNPIASGRLTFVNQAPTDAIGHTLVDVLAEGIGGKGKAVIVTGSPTAPNQNEWMKHMRRRLEMYPEIELLETIAPGEDQNAARQKVRQTIGAHPDLAGIWGITSLALPGSAEAVKQEGKTGKIFVTGLSLPSAVRSYVKDGTIPKFVLWNPIDLGYLTVHVAHALREGPLEPGTRSFGRLQNIEIRESEVILGPPTIFDASNVDQFDF